MSADKLHRIDFQLEQNSETGQHLHRSPRCRTTVKSQQRAAKLSKARMRQKHGSLHAVHDLLRN
jgi:hypothetical protein